METLAWYSYKGGVGRTLLLANTARFLALCGARVVALDLDLEAPGLHYKLDVPSRLGAVDVLLALRDGDELPPLTELAVPVHTRLGAGGSLHLICAGKSPESGYFEKLHRLHHPGPQAEPGGLLEAVLELQARIEEELRPDYLLVDSRTGVTELSALATTALADRVVLMFTPHRENWEGTAAVYRALRAAPRLGGAPRDYELLLTRLQEGSPREDEAMKTVFPKWTVLPQDPVDGAAERAVGARPPLWGEMRDEHPEPGSLLSISLKWMAEIFPRLKANAEGARRHMEAVDRAIGELTYTYRRVGQWWKKRDAWDPKQLELSVPCRGRKGDVRTADIIARRPGDPPDRRMAMVVEFVNDESPHAVAQWWIDAVMPDLVVLLHGDSDRTWFNCRGIAGEAWAFPTPEDFVLLANPIDRSLDALLAAAARSDSYNEAIIRKWVRYQVIGPRGRVSGESLRARKVEDTIARIDEPRLAAAFVAECSFGAAWRDMWIESGDDYLDDLVHRELCAPLCWRIPPVAFVALSESQREFAPARFGLQLVAQLLGLQYDPDASFRRAVGRLTLLTTQDSWSQARELYRSRALRFTISDAVATLPQSADLIAAEQALRNRLPIQGWLGCYDALSAKVTLYQPIIDETAARLAVTSRHLGSVVLLHLSVLGLLHQAEDLDGERWEGFSTGDPSPWVGEVPLPLLVFTQMVVDQVLVRLRDPRLTETFKVLTDHQPPAFRLHRRLGPIGAEEIRAWVLCLRRGSPPGTLPDLRALLREETRVSQG